MADMCGAEFGDFFNGTIVPLVAYATLVTSIMIALALMAGRAIANAKLTLWAKTEAVQILISVASIFFLLATLNLFCGINMNDVATIFEITPPGTGHLSVYDAAQQYLNEAAIYSHNALTVVRYHLEAYTIFSFFNAFMCDFSTGGIGWGCLFGYSGDNMQPLGGYGATLAALNMSFNSALMAHFSALNCLFILLFVYKGFVFVFLPLGVFLRSMPYMRSFGSLLIALAMSFLIVYPFLLGVFYLMGGLLVDRSNDYAPGGIDMDSYDERIFPDSEGAAAAGLSISAGATEGQAAYDMYFPGNENLTGAIMFAAQAFVAAVFFPLVALLATIGSVVYIARLYGEEIDLSRITQLV